jgi:hypothetical protein
VKVQSDGRFHGDARITQAEAAAAMSKMAHALIDGTWKPAGRSRSVPDSVTSIWSTTDWKSEPVRRYAFAVILARFGDYVSNGLKRAPAGAKVGKSVVFPPVTVALSKSSPSYEPVSYLARNHMIRPGSPLLKPDASPLLGGELSRALAEVGAGVSDQLTDLGHTEDGSTPDDSFHKRTSK